MKAGGAKRILHTDENRLGRDLLGLFSIFFSILLILSLASFDGRDPWLNHVVGGSQNIGNKTGLFGAYTAGFLYDMFGAAAWVLPVFLSTAGARRILGAAPWPWWRWSGFILLALCIGIAGAAGDLGDMRLFVRDALPAGSGNVSSHGGGIAGHMLYVWLLGWLGSTGAFLVWLFMLLPAVQVLSGISLPLLAYAACVALQRRFTDLLRAIGRSAATRRSAATAGTGRQPHNNSAGRAELVLYRDTRDPAHSPDISPPHDAGTSERLAERQMEGLFPGLPQPVEDDGREVFPGPVGDETSPVRDNSSDRRTVPAPSRSGEAKHDERREQGQAADMPEVPSMSANGAIADDEDIPPWVHDFENDRLGPPPFNVVPAGGFSAPERPAEHEAPAGGETEISCITCDFLDSAHPADDFPAPDPHTSTKPFSPQRTEEPPPDPVSPATAGYVPEEEESAGAHCTPGRHYEPGHAQKEERGDTGAGSDRLPSSLPTQAAENRRADLSRAGMHDQEAPLPPLDILEAAALPSRGIQRDVLEQKGKNLMNCLHDFGIQGELAAITPGPVVTMFEIKPAPGVRVARIAGLSDDLALALKAAAVRIQAPVPGTDSVGIEIPNTARETVCLKELLGSSVFRQSSSLLTLALGKDTAGNPVTADLASMPHLLVAGATGAGKSVGINSIILSILYKAGPDQVKLLLVDPKRVEMSIYADLPHLVHPVVTEMPLAKSALEWAVSEMERRYDAIAGAGVRNITDYNAKISSWGGNPPPGMEEMTTIPFLVLIIDELADLMLVASKEVETSIVRLAQLARAAGIHLILATQRPSVDVVTGLIKANFPCRMAFQVTSKHDSRTILDTVGAEHLLGKGDMLFKPAGGKFRRLHGAFVSDRNVNAVVDYWKARQRPDYTIDFADMGQEGAGSAPSAGGAMDINAEPLYNEAVEFVRSQGKASISLIQRKFRIGFNKAARYVEQMEADGIIGPADGSKPRPVIK